MKRKDTLIKVTPKKAAEFLKSNNYPGQRAKVQRHINELAEKMEDGRFNTGQVAIVVGLDGVTYLADGQHQCEACILSGVQFSAVYMHFTVEKGDSKQAIAEVFAQFNGHRARSRGDIAWIYGAHIGMADWSRKCVQLCNSALGWIAGGFGESGTILLSKDENARLLAAKKSACTFVYRTAFNGHVKTARHLARSPVAAAMLVTFDKNLLLAEEFWEAVRDGEMIKRSDPRMTLREFLVNSSVKSTSAKGGAAVSQREMYVKCIHAWNAYLSGKTTSLKYYANKPIPQVLQDSE